MELDHKSGFWSQLEWLFQIYAHEQQKIHTRKAVAQSVVALEIRLHVHLGSPCLEAQIKEVLVWAQHTTPQLCLDFLPLQLSENAMNNTQRLLLTGPAMVLQISVARAVEVQRKSHSSSRKIATWFSLSTSLCVNDSLGKFDLTWETHLFSLQPKHYAMSLICAWAFKTNGLRLYT